MSQSSFHKRRLMRRSRRTWRSSRCRGGSGGGRQRAVQERGSSHLSMKPFEERSKEKKCDVLEILSQLDKDSKSSTTSSQVSFFFWTNFRRLEGKRVVACIVGSKNAVEITLRNLRRLAASSSTDAKSSDEDEDEALFVASVRVLTIMCSKTPANRVKFATFGEAASLIMDRMKSKPNSAKTQVAGFNAVRTSCTKNPQNTNAFAKLGILDHLLLVRSCVSNLSQPSYPSNECRYWNQAKQCECRRCESRGKWCVLLEVMALSIQNHPSIKNILPKTMPWFCFSKRWSNIKSEDIVASCCRAMEAICVNDTTCKEAESAGGLKLLTNLIRDQKDCEKVVAKCASCLSCFARCDLNKPKIVRIYSYFFREDSTLNSLDIKNRYNSECVSFSSRSCKPRTLRKRRACIFTRWNWSQQWRYVNRRFAIVSWSQTHTRLRWIQWSYFPQMRMYRERHAWWFVTSCLETNNTSRLLWMPELNLWFALELHST